MTSKTRTYADVPMTEETVVKEDGRFLHFYRFPSDSDWRDALERRDDEPVTLLSPDSPGEGQPDV